MKIQLIGIQLKIKNKFMLSSHKLWILAKLQAKYSLSLIQKELTYLQLKITTTFVIQRPKLKFIVHQKIKIFFKKKFNWILFIKQLNRLFIWNGLKMIKWYLFEEMVKFYFTNCIHQVILQWVQFLSNVQFKKKKKLIEWKLINYKLISHSIQV